MNAHKVSPKLITFIIVALFFAVALSIRVLLPYDRIFTNELIKFASVDAYYHMHLIDNLVHNFPHLSSFDPYLIYPGGAGVGHIRFFDWLLAAIIWVVGLGSPTQHTIDLIGVYFPAVLGALTIIPIYFIARGLFGRWAAMLSAALLAVLPGEFVGRSILGFTDHHVAETLFTTITMMFLILAIKTGKQRGLTFSHLKRQNWATSARPIIYSLLAAVFMGAYIFTFLGALLFIFIIFSYFVIQFAIDHLKGKSTDYLSLISIPFFSITLILSLLISPGRLYLISLIIALIIPIALSGISRLMGSKKIKPAYYPLAMFGLGLAGLGTVHIINPSLLGSMLDTFDIFFPTATSRTTIEMQPILFPNGKFSAQIVWGNFTTSFFLFEKWAFPGLSLISLIIVTIYFTIIKGNAEKTLLVVWSLIILAATLGQRRFAYYFAVNVALLTGYTSVLLYYATRFITDRLRGARTDYVSWQILEFPDIKELAAGPIEQPPRVESKKVKKLERKQTKKIEREKFLSEKRPEVRFLLTPTHLSIILWIIIVFFLVFYPSLLSPSFENAPTIITARQARFAPSDAWCSSLSWLKENTPDPLGNPDSYYKLHEPPPPGESYNYPESAYGIMSWWDYGYWITRIAHRIPNANPSQDTQAVTNVANFFTSQDEGTANNIAQELGSSYVVIDAETATSKFWAIATWARKNLYEYFEVYYVPQEKQMKAFIYPPYYHSLAARLYNFDGKAVIPESTQVISYTEQEGIPFKIISDEKQFDSYEEAQAYISSQESTNYRIVSTDVLSSPVPLEALEHYSLIYGSEEVIAHPKGNVIPEVKIFEYRD
ncbi:oligosaccharyl transferase, archaeosortase A system-associated [Chloroflexota bacterium]